MRLQTAVGMPVAMDPDGNMCIVVMFSANNVLSSDQAMEYLQNISKSAASKSIPCLLPVIDSCDQTKITPDAEYQHHGESGSPDSLAAPQHFGEGVTARFVSFQSDDGTEVHTVHEVTQAPKDCYGIPMLPSVAELGNPKPDDAGKNGSASPQEYDAFDEASYGVWSTVMDTPADSISPHVVLSGGILRGDGNTSEAKRLSAASRNSSSSTVSLAGKPIMPSQRRERLEEFCIAFLGMSVFDVADVWIPCPGDDTEILSHVTTVTATQSSDALNFFKRLSEGVYIKIWSGAAGRAYGSGNPVWSANSNVIVDADRSSAFKESRIQTALAVPIFSSGAVSPSCVLCCYSLVRFDSVPFVLKFVQQALRLLWEGLDRVEPHESVGRELWSDVAAADLGEMAADTEMQTAFLKKKRPHDAVSSNDPHQRKDAMCPPLCPKSKRGKNITNGELRNRSSSLALQMDSLNMPSGASMAPVEGMRLPPPGVCLGPAPLLPSAVLTFNSIDPQLAEAPRQEKQAIFSLHNDIHEALRSVGEAVPWPVHHHAYTNADDTTKAYLQSTAAASPVVTSAQQMQSQLYQQTHNQQHYFTQINAQSNSVQAASMPNFPTGTNVPLTQHLHPHTTFSKTSPPTTHSNISNATQEPRLFGKPVSLPNNNSSLPSQTQFKEERAVALANIKEFNAMARMQGAAKRSRLTTHEPCPTQPPAVIQSWSNGSSSTFSDPNLSKPALSAPKVSSDVSVTPEGSIMIPDLSSSQSSAVAALSQTLDAVNGLICLPISEGVSAGSVRLQGKGKSCRIQGCDDISVARRPYCLRHSGNRMCEHDGCTKCAQGSTRFCIAHGGGRRCTHPGCDKGARDKFFCAAHGGGKRCSTGGCNKSAVGGSSFCTSHGGGRRCEVEGCEKSAQSSTKFCVKHGGGKKCSHSGCDKVSRGRTLYCAAHGGGVRCKLEGCNRVAIGKLQLCRAHGGGSNSKNSITTD